MKKLGFEEDICDRRRHKQLRFSYNDVLWTELWRKKPNSAYRRNRKRVKMRDFLNPVR